MKKVYGPVDSWRLDRSLGVDLIATEGRRCSFDCLYCQIQNVGEIRGERKEFVEIEELKHELERALERVGDQTDYVTLSGMGEPTLASNLEEGIDMIGEVTDKPRAILTNGSLFDLKEVREPLRSLDYVIAQLDAATDETFQRVNRPAGAISLDDIVQGYRKFSDGYEGKFALEVMFWKENVSEAEDIAELVNKTGADEVQINTPLRPGPVDPLSREELKSVRKYFEDIEHLDVMDVFEGKGKKSKTLDEKEIIKRGRPIK